MPIFNQPEMTERSVRSVLKNSVSDYKLFFIDNGSSREIRNLFEEKYIDNKRIIYLRSEKNEGCATGKNIGLRQLDNDCRYVIMLDYDVYVPSGWDEKLIGFMERHSEVGLSGPSTNYAWSLQKIEGMPYLNTEEEIEKFALEHTAGKNFRIAKQKGLIIGFCQIVRKEVYDEIGLLDENFKLYGGEDNDFCYRVQEAEWELAYIDSVFVYHYGNAGYGLLDAKTRDDQFVRNKNYFAEKHGYHI